MVFQGSETRGNIEKDPSNAASTTYVPSICCNVVGEMLPTTSLPKLTNPLILLPTPP